MANRLVFGDYDFPKYTDEQIIKQITEMVVKVIDQKNGCPLSPAQLYEWNKWLISAVVGKCS